jgi:catalase
MYNADKDYGKGVAKLAKAPMAKVRQTAKDLMEQQAARAAKAKQVAESLTALMQ